MHVSKKLDPDVANWVTQSIGKGAKLTSIIPAKGATSSSVYFIKSTAGKYSLDCVLRLFTNQDWLEEEPDLAEHEASVLIEAQKAELPAPRLIAYAVEKSECGVPAVLMTFLKGQVDLCPNNFDQWLAQLAESLVVIHRVSSTDLRWEYFSWTNKNDLKPPAWSKYPELWEYAIEIWLSVPPVVDYTLIHRDYHPTNVLWDDGELCSIVDWVNGCKGPASVDVSHCFGNLLAMYGLEVAEKFLSAYEQSVGSEFAHHPYWDIDSILSSLPDPEYYPPWQDFGLGWLDQNLIRDRIDEHLRVVVSRIR